MKGKNIFVPVLIVLTACGGGGNGQEEETGGGANLVAEDDQYTVERSIDTTLNVLSNDTIPNGSSVSVELVDSSSDRLSVVNNAIVYSAPNSDEFRTVFNYRITVGNQSSQAQVVVESVQVSNPIPILSPSFDVGVTVTNQALDLDVLSNDNASGGDTLTLTEIPRAPQNGSVEIFNNQIQYTPDENFWGFDNFTYAVEDQSNNSYSGVLVQLLVQAKVDDRYTQLKLDTVSNYELTDVGFTLTRDYFDTQPVVVSKLGDFDGDGRDDFVSCYSYATVEGEEDAGECAITTSSSDSLIRLYSDTAGARFGFRASPAGDVNGDGFDDLNVFNTTLSSSEVEGYIVLGGADNSEDFLVTRESSEDNARIIDANISVDLLRNIQSLGDINNDGFDDVALFMETLDQERYIAIRMGSQSTDSFNAATIFIGGGFHILSGSASDFSLEAMHYGSKVVPLGDINGDNYDDFAVKAVDRGRITPLYGVQIIYGQANFTDFTYFMNNELVVPREPTEALLRGTFLGTETPVFNPEVILGDQGDFNGDDEVELLLQFENRVVLFSLEDISIGRHGLENTDRWLTHFEDIVGSGNYTRMSNIGDINGNGIDDFLIHRNNGLFSNSIVLTYGSENLPEAIDYTNYLLENGGQGVQGAIIEDLDTEVGTVLGTYSVGIGDFNGDGLADFAIGGLGESNTDGEGEISVLYGASHWGGANNP